MNLYKALCLSVLIAGSWSSSAIAADRWEAQGRASTGEKVYLNLDSIQIDRRSLGFETPPGYFFTYQIGRDRPQAFTPCDGRFQVGIDGVFQSLITPQSQATRKMLERVCSYHRKSALVFAPPSNVRVVPNGNILCSVNRKQKVMTYGLLQYDDEANWLYTDVCGKLGVIHTSQIRF
ncbi:MAG: hypothetical protein HC857_12190 [Synechococcales cyanobacterium RU_4_20]|nr:hypothetical protein [Synechococcales cyanobacterium RU_4_20]NJR67509.1 hypothetical protein [Synechococcales cyanobacterium CRU_2_2]